MLLSERLPTAAVPKVRLLLASALWATSCSTTATTDHSAAAVRDSAGIVIVENSGYAWSEQEAWKVSDSAALIIGEVDGPIEYELFNVMGATRLATNRIAIANAGTHEIRMYDAEGTWVASSGGPGEGPGEYQQLRGVWPYKADSLFVWDYQLRRAAILTADGVFVRHIQLQAPAANPLLLRPVGPSSMLLADYTYDFGSTTVSQQMMMLIILEPDGRSATPLGEFPADKTIRIEAGGMPYIASPIFSSETSFTVADSLVYVGRGSDPQIEGWTLSKRLDRLIRWVGGDRTVKQMHVEAYEAERLEAESDDQVRRWRREIIHKSPVESHFPAYDRIVADHRGNVWVKLYRRPGESGPQPWMVIDTDGRTLGEVMVPERLRPLEIGEDYMIGTWADEFGVTSVRVYEIRK